MERLLIEFAIRTTLMVAGTALVLGVLRVKAAAARHAAWTGVLALMLLLPAWTAWGPKATVRVLPATSAAVVLEPPPAGAVTEAINNVPMRPAHKNSTVPWREVVLGAYAFGALWLLLRLAIGTIRANRLTSANCVAPITVGLLRPRVILPESWTEWSPEQLEAILAHEHAHVRRHDVLVRWLALLNRALFWFHPLSWWLERKLAGLAEEACDNAVLDQGHDPGAYAQCLLDVERSVMRAGTRFAAVGMAMPGSALPHRVKKIFDGAKPPSISRNRMLCAFAACSITGALFAAGTLDRAPGLLPLGPLPALAYPKPPVLLAQAQSQGPAAAARKPSFEVASIRPAAPVPRDVPGGAQPRLVFGRINGGPGTDDPERITARLMTLKNVLLKAYGVQSFQISGPGSMDAQFDIEAKVPSGATVEQLNLMLQNLLEERFHLKVHHETKDFAAFNLVVAKGGLKLKDSVDSAFQSKQVGIARSANQNDDCVAAAAPAPGMRTPCGRPATDGQVLFGKSASMASVANILRMLDGGAPVFDQTGLTDLYDIRLEFAPNYAGAPDDSPLPSVFTALEKDLGLKLESSKAPFDVVVIDHIDSTPTDN